MTVNSVQTANTIYTYLKENLPEKAWHTSAAEFTMWAFRVAERLEQYVDDAYIREDVTDTCEILHRWAACRALQTDKYTEQGTRGAARIVFATELWVAHLWKMPNLKVHTVFADEEEIEEILLNNAWRTAS